MGNSELKASAESAIERQYDVVDSWVDLFGAGARLQVDLAAALARVTVRTGQLLQREHGTLALSWPRTTAGTRDATGRTDESGTATRRWVDSEGPATTPASPRTGAPEFGESPDRRITPQEHPTRTPRESGGTSVATTARRTGGDRREAEGAEPARHAEAGESDAATRLDQWEALGPEETKQLRSTDVRTVEQLAAARPKELAAETGLHQDWIRVWVFRARRVGNR